MADDVAAGELEPAGEQASGGASARTRFLEVFALSGFVFTQPVLDVMGRSPELFVFRRAGTAEIVALTALLVVAPAVALFACEAAARLIAGRRRAELVHRAIVGGLLVLLAIQVVKNVASLHRSVVLLVAVAVAAGALLLYLRFAWARTWLRYLSLAPLVFAGLFLAASPVSDLVFPGDRASAAQRGVKAGPPVIVLLLDEFPLMSLLTEDGKVDGRLYPNFARLAERSHWFRNATGVSGYTPYALPAMLTGRYPKDALAPTASQYPENLFTLVAGAYRLDVSESITALCPRDLCEPSDVGPSGLRPLLRDAARAWRAIASPSRASDDVTQTLVEETAGDHEREPVGSEGEPSATDTQFNFSRLADNQPARFEAFLRELDGARPPTLHFLHLLLPHVPFRYQPSGMQYKPHSFIRQERLGWDDETWPPRQTLQRHLLQAVYTDRLVGRFLDRLEAEGLYDRSLVVVASDHGIGFVPGQKVRLLDDDNVSHLAWVPFFVKLPGQQDGTVSDANVEMVDVVPTIADVLGITLPWKVDGVSVFGRPRATTAKSFFRIPGQPISVESTRWFPDVVRGFAGRIAQPELGPDGLFRVGPHRELVGTRPEEHSVLPTDVSGSLDDGGAYDRVDPSTGTVPALVLGRIDDLPRRPRAVAVAVAVNGRIGGVSELFQDGDTPNRFVTVVPAEQFVSGQNAVDVYLVVERQGRVELQPVRLR